MPTIAAAHAEAIAAASRQVQTQKLRTRRVSRVNSVLTLEVYAC